MNLFLLRHADADTRAARDDDRRLSEKGINQAKRVGRFCRAQEIIPERILTSPVIRARETADLFAAEIGGVSVELAPFLACGMEPERALRELKAWENVESVMIVGHEPDFGLLITRLLGLGENGRIRVRKASLILLEVAALRPGGARLEFSVPARFMS
jgi:phosphohistidine phosphatase